MTKNDWTQDSVGYFGGAISGSSAFLFDGEFIFQITGGPSVLNQIKLWSIYIPRSGAVFISLYSSLWIISGRQGSNVADLNHVYTSFDSGFSWTRTEIILVNGARLSLARSKAAGMLHEKNLCLFGGEKRASESNSVVCSVPPANPPPRDCSCIDTSYRLGSQKNSSLLGTFRDSTI